MMVMEILFLTNPVCLFLFFLLLSKSASHQDRKSGRHSEIYQYHCNLGWIYQQADWIRCNPVTLLVSMSVGCCFSNVTIPIEDPNFITH